MIIVATAPHAMPHGSDSPLTVALGCAPRAETARGSGEGPAGIEVPVRACETRDPLGTSAHDDRHKSRARLARRVCAISRTVTSPSGLGLRAAARGCARPSHSRPHRRHAHAAPCRPTPPMRRQRAAAWRQSDGERRHLVGGARLAGRRVGRRIEPLRRSLCRRRLPHRHDGGGGVRPAASTGGGAAEGGRLIRRTRAVGGGAVVVGLPFISEHRSGPHVLRREGARLYAAMEALAACLVAVSGAVLGERVGVTVRHLDLLGGRLVLADERAVVARERADAQQD
mmetsp:Transcript_10029/g.26739  ORF Transcript_10029/g.26739 Transcript_10029/m.26739 type:complete len:284 (-) Transcript_10029:566-1417(-)